MTVPSTMIGKLAASDSPAPRLNTARYAPIIIRSPCAKLIRRRIPKTIASPTAINA